MGNKRNDKKSQKKAPLTYSIELRHEDEIRGYVDGINERTRLPKQKIVTDLILESIRRDTKIVS